MACIVWCSRAAYKVATQMGETADIVEEAKKAGYIYIFLDEDDSVNRDDYKAGQVALAIDHISAITHT